MESNLHLTLAEGLLLSLPLGNLAEMVSELLHRLLRNVLLRSIAVSLATLSHGQKAMETSGSVCRTPDPSSSAALRRTAPSGCLGRTGGCAGRLHRRWA